MVPTCVRICLSWSATPTVPIRPTASQVTKIPDGVPDKRETFEGDKVVVHDNRGLCAHAGRCTLETVFRPSKEPFVDANGASADQIIETIKQCPSGALSYSIDGVEHAERGGDPQIGVAPNGPYICSGGVKLEDVELPEGAPLITSPCVAVGPARTSTFAPALSGTCSSMRTPATDRP